jgi:hypothetical protein
VVLVVLALFFLPFLMDDLVRRSQPAAVGVVVFVWVALRALTLARR